MSSQFAANIPCGSRALIRWALAALAVTFASLLALGYSAATADGQETPPDPVDTVTEAENVPREAEQAPGDAQRLLAPVDRAGQRTSSTTARAANHGAGDHSRGNDRSARANRLPPLRRQVQ